jgi:hypothetical protein
MGGSVSVALAMAQTPASSSAASQRLDGTKERSGVGRVMGRLLKTKQSVLISQLAYIPCAVMPMERPPEGGRGVPPLLFGVNMHRFILARVRETAMTMAIGLALCQTCWTFI